MNAPRRYTDEEFARILRRATEFATTPDGGSGEGLTLVEMQAAAAEVGLDPSLVARAAQLEVAPPPASLLERIVGGPLRHEQAIRVPITMNEVRAERLLSAARLGARPFSSDGPGHASALGVTWASSGEGDVLHVSARADTGATELSVQIDRRGTFVIMAMVASFAGFMVVLFGMSGVWPGNPVFGLATVVIGGAGILAAVRRFWTASTTTARQHIIEMLETMRGAME